MNSSKPPRPPEHVLEDISRVAVKHILVDAGWVVCDIAPDYGEDALVFIYENGRATGEVFFLQIKATARERRPSRPHIPLSVSAGVAHRWAGLPLPVVVVLYVRNTDTCYWLLTEPPRTSADTARQRLAQRTRKLFEYHGAMYLIRHTLVVYEIE